MAGVCVLVRRGGVGGLLCAPSGRFAPGKNGPPRRPQTHHKRAFVLFSYFLISPSGFENEKARLQALTRRLPIAITVCVALPRPACLPAEFSRPLGSAGSQRDKRFSQQRQ